MTYALEVLLAALSLFGVALIIDGVCANRADESRQIDKIRERTNQALATPVREYGRGPATFSAARGSVPARSGAPSSLPWAKDERTDTRVFNLLPREGSMSGAPSMASRRAAPARRPYTLGGAR